tara:strand:+ start:142 stop:567 length:426 start_codon:yes stop_codon:yes gene_type:complete
MSEIDSNTGETSLDDKNCPYFPTLEEIATTRFEFMFPKYDMLVPFEQKEFHFPEPYNPQAQGIMPVHEHLKKSTPYELLKADNVDQSRIQLSQNVSDLILQNLETSNNIIEKEEREYRTRGNFNRRDYENIQNIVIQKKNT